ncbi:MAG: HAMP domain-containing histidine kinase [Myxococcales bacterium]|nr:HAMP domain-containing histidine kinase [Myxococcales bacterium]
MRPRLGLRGRIVVSIVAVGLPASLALVSAAWWIRRDALLENAYAATLDLLSDGEGCAAGAPVQAAGRTRSRGRHALTIVDTWDRAGAPTGATRRPLPGALRRSLTTAIPPATWDGDHVVVATPHTGGPCAIVGVALRAPGYAAVPAAPMAVVGALLLGALALTIGVLRDPLRRLARLERVARGSSSGETLASLSVEGTDEIAAVTRALREAGRRIQEQMQAVEQRDTALRDYVAATTHDLALPLTVIQSHVASLLDDGSPTPADADRLRAILVECEYAAQLLANAAAAARLSTEGAHPSEEELDLRELVIRVCERQETLARSVGVALEHAVPDDGVAVLGDDLLLERALSNLVHNAIRHRPPGAEGHVAVLLEATMDGARLTVASDGALGGAAEVRARLEGEVGAHRPRRGLAIVRQIFDAHGWRGAVTTGPEGELRVVIAIDPRRPQR